jgi:serine/threonine-protein kinase
MPLLRGESLDLVLARRGTLPVNEALALLLPVISGVRAAHERGVIHRDLKPQNVFVASPDVYVLDFGLAKLLGGSDEAADKLTRTGALLGTPHYMAPEQLFGDARVDHCADVWAIGVILYECVSGQRPIEGRSYGQIVKNAARGAIKTFAEAAPHASAEVVALVTRMLTPERDGRPDLAEVEARARALTS